MNIDAVVFPLSVNGIPDDNKRVDVKEAFPSPSREGNERDGPIAFALMRRGWPPFRIEKEKENWILVTIWINYVSLILFAPPLIFSSTRLFWNSFSSSTDDAVFSRAGKSCID